MNAPTTSPGPTQSTHPALLLAELVLRLVDAIGGGPGLLWRLWPPARAEWREFQATAREFAALMQRLAALPHPTQKRQPAPGVRPHHARTPSNHPAPPRETGFTPRPAPRPEPPVPRGKKRENQRRIVTPISLRYRNQPVICGIACGMIVVTIEASSAS